MLLIYSLNTDMTISPDSFTRRCDLVARLRLTTMEEMERAKGKRS
jgi:hypothetical protein